MVLILAEPRLLRQPRLTSLWHRHKNYVHRHAQWLEKLGHIIFFSWDIATHLQSRVMWIRKGGKAPTG